jgi:hypothetical protein
MATERLPVNAMTDRLSLPPDVVEWYLGKWAEWMMASHDQRGYGKGDFAVSSRSTFEQLVAQVDVRASRIVDSCIRDLEPLEQAAISHAYLQAVWRWNRRPFQQIYDQAIAQLGRMFATKGLT